MLAERLTAQLLAGRPATDSVAVAERLLAIQAQDERGARLAVRARTSGLSAADVDHALSVDRTLLITWLNRGTLHLVRSEDYPLLQALTTPQLHVTNARRLAQEGVTPVAADRGVEAMRRALDRDGPLNRSQLRERIAAAGVRTEGQALVHILVRACLRGIAVRGPIVDGKHCYVLVAEWLGELPTVDRARGLPELARRFLVGHGPADERDLAKWAGIPLRDARAGLAGIASLLAQRPDGLVGLAARTVPADALPARLLGPWDPVLLGWRSRSQLLGSGEPAIIVGGLFRPFALLHGHAAGVWKLVRGNVVLEPFARLSQADAGALAADARDVERYLA